MWKLKMKLYYHFNSSTGKCKNGIKVASGKTPDGKGDAQVLSCSKRPLRFTQPLSVTHIIYIKFHNKVPLHDGSLSYPLCYKDVAWNN